MDNASATLQTLQRPDLSPEARVDIFRRWRWEATADLRHRGVIQALTIWPEWVWAIMFLDKDREYRGWHPPKDLIGKRLAIHAGANIGGRKGMKARSEGLEAVTRMARRAGWTVDATGGPEKVTLTFSKGDKSAVMVPDEIPKGAIVATALIADVTDDTATGEPWKADTYGWKLGDLEVLSTPIPCLGMQGLWFVANAGGPVP